MNLQSYILLFIILAVALSVLVHYVFHQRRTGGCGSCQWCEGCRERKYPDCPKPK